jgi:hypothetical protein
VTFSEALTEIFAGKLVTREAWHGEIFVYLEKPESIDIDADHPLVNVYPANTKLAHHAYVAMKSHGVVLPWAPGQPDMFADYWSMVAV